MELKLLLTETDPKTKDILKNRFKRYDFRKFNIDVLDTGLDCEMLDLLVDIYIRPEIKEKGNNEKINQ